MDGRTYGRMDGWKISPFYRTSSPIGAAAPLQPNFNLKTIKRGKGTADHMMPLGAWLSDSVLKLLPPGLATRHRCFTDFFGVFFWLFFWFFFFLFFGFLGFLVLNKNPANEDFAL